LTRPSVASRMTIIRSQGSWRQRAVPLLAQTCRPCAACLALIVSAAIAMAQAPETGPNERPPGDTITLTNGAQMNGVQVLRKTAMNYHVQVIEGVVMSIPVNQVREIDYDENRRHGARSGGGGEAGDGEEIRAQEMAPALNSVLTRPLKEPFTMVDEDFLFVLEAVSVQFGFQVELRAPVHDIPAEDRRWTFEVPEGATLLRLFRDDLPARFPDLAAVPQFDRVVVTTREDALESGLIKARQGRDNNNDIEANNTAPRPDAG
jgi:hypothetical protein